MREIQGSKKPQAAWKERVKLSGVMANSIRKFSKITGRWWEKERQVERREGKIEGEGDPTQRRVCLGQANGRCPTHLSLHQRSTEMKGGGQSAGSMMSYKSLSSSQPAGLAGRFVWGPTNRSVPKIQIQNNLRILAT